MSSHLTPNLSDVGEVCLSILAELESYWSSMSESGFYRIPFFIPRCFIGCLLPSSVGIRSIIFCLITCSHDDNK